MNCKQGERAMIVRLHRDFTPFERRIMTRLLGRVVVCHQRVDLDGCPVWLFEAPEHVRMAPLTCVISGAPDSILMPIRDPGDDAVDEMLLRVGKPEGVTA